MYAQEASAAAAKAVAADREAKATLRRDAEALLPERFTSPEGPVKLPGCRSLFGPPLRRAVE